MRHRTALIQDRTVLLHTASPLRWAARLLALGYGLLTALYLLGCALLIAIGASSRGETAETMLYLLAWLPALVPLLLAVLAWRRHLLGGALITASAVALYAFLGFRDSLQWGWHVYLVPWLAAGLLHLLAWHMEKKGEAAPA